MLKLVPAGLLDECGLEAMTALMLRVVLFAAFLMPVTIGDLSINYAFVLYALFLAIQARRIEKPSNFLLAAIAAYSVIYLVGLAFDIFASDAMLLRRVVSFAIFMTMFAFVLVPFGALETRAFKIAVVAVSLGFSIYAIARFYSVGGNSYGFALKDVTGSQRYGFVYLLGIFCLMTASSKERWFQIGRAVALFMIVSGLLLTFSRSSIVAMGCVLPLFLLAPLVTATGRFVTRLSIAGRRTGIAALYAAALLAFFPVAFQFYGDLILSRYIPLVETTLVTTVETTLVTTELPAQDNVRDRVFVTEGSEGTRLLIWKAIIASTLDQPLTGSSYLGVWQLDGASSGSAHSQYFDVLMRTGFIGVLLYIIIIGQVLIFLWRREPGLFWGVLAMMVFGFFHETFKESQGAFILACLIGIHGAYRREVSCRVQDVNPPVALSA